MFRFTARRTPAAQPVTDRAVISDIAQQIYLAITDLDTEVVKDDHGLLVVRARGLTARVVEHTSRTIDLSKHIVLRKPQFRGS